LNIIESSTDAEKTKRLIENMRETKDKLQNVKYKQQYKKMLDQMREDSKYIKPSYVGNGQDEYGRQEYENELKQHMGKKKYKKLDLTPQMF
jgi:hypothetical protein